MDVVELNAGVDFGALDVGAVVDELWLALFGFAGKELGGKGGEGVAVDAEGRDGWFLDFCCAFGFAMFFVDGDVVVLIVGFGKGDELHFGDGAEPLEVFDLFFPGNVENEGVDVGVYTAAV